MKTVMYKDNKLYVHFKFPWNDPEFNNTLNKVKSLYGREFIMESKKWIVPPTDTNIEKLAEWEFDFDDSCIRLFEKENTEENYKNIPIDKSQLKKLYPFQLEAVQFLEYHKGKGLIGDDMGIGKTIESLSYFKIHKEKRPILIICPASIKLNWEREIYKWVSENEKVIILYGNKNYDIKDFDFCIINYDILGYGQKVEYEKDGVKKEKIILAGGWYETFLNIEWKGIIVDECQYLSTPSTIRTMAFKQIKKVCNDNIIFLSGTPLKNKPSELFTVLNTLDKNKFPNYYKYKERYCNPKHNGYGWIYKGVSNWKELHREVKNIMIRRSKSEVLKDLPEKNRIIIPLECNEKYYDKYIEEENSIIENMDSRKKLERQNDFDKLKGMAYFAKRDSIISWLKDYILTGNKIIVSAYHISVLDDLCSCFNKKNYVRIDGSVPSVKRQSIVDRFQTDENTLLFFGQILAAGVGITLTAASASCFVEFGWTPADHIQFEDRVHRIGQMADSVFAYYLVANGTIEQHIVELLQQKYDVISKVLDGKENQTLFDNSILDDLFNRLKGNK